MENPLKKYFKIDLRADGLYISVDRKKRDMVPFEDVERDLRRAYVINCDIPKLHGIINRAKGVFEKLGSDFEYYDLRMDNFIEVKMPSEMRATMNISSAVVAQGIKPTIRSIVVALNRKSVTYGIDENIIQDFLAKGDYDKTIDVAAGLPPEPGIDGVVSMQIEIDPGSQPKILQNGRTDYRDITTFVTVKAGQVIANRIPPKRGKDGISVTGSRIESTIGVDVALPAGKNTVISKDGGVLSATKEGILFEKDGTIHVGELLSIAGDVNFAVGNIKYSGDVIINGGVNPGFVVEAEGNIEVNGEVESAKIISRKGFVTIDKGIIGKGNTEIYGFKGVSVNFAQECVIKSEGNITFSKHLLHCSSRSESLTSEKKGASIIGGTATVFKYVDIPNIGNNTGVETKINIIDKHKRELERKKSELLVVKEKIKKQMEPISRELKNKTAILKKLGKNVTDRHKAELAKWVESYNQFSVKLKYIDENVAKLLKEIGDVTRLDGYIKVSEKVYKGTKLNLYDITAKEVNAILENKRFLLSKDSAIVEESSDGKK